MHSPTIPFSPSLHSARRAIGLNSTPGKKLLGLGLGGRSKSQAWRSSISPKSNLAFREVEEPPQSMAVLSPQVLMQPSCLPVWVTTIPRSSSLWSCRSNFCPLHLSTSRLHSKRMWFDLLKTSRSPRAFSLRQVQGQPNIWQLPPLWWRLRARHAAGMRKAPKVSFPSAEMEIFDGRSPKARAF